MAERGGDGGNRGPRRPVGRAGGGRASGGGRAGSGAGGGGVGPGPGGKPKPRGGIWLQRLNGQEFALSHPKCIHEMEPDYEEGLELRREGDPEGARDALRYALQGCGDNIYVHVALGKIALEDFKDPSLAQGHFGYAFELARKAIPGGFSAKLPREHPANRPLYEAIDGLVACHAGLGEPELAEELKGLASRWLAGPGGGAPRAEL